MVRTKVFVGNLDFRTREAELAKAFAVAGKVISANIITRGPRSLGYGFVEFDNEEDANNAVKALNKTEVDGRPINVEVAKAREELQQQQQQNQQDNQAQNQNENQQSSEDSGRGGRGRGRGGRGGRGTRGTRGTRGAPRGGARGGRGGGYRRRDESTEGKQEQPQQQQQNNNQNQQQQQQPDNRTPSKTLLFVANLPFKLDDDTFGQIFKDAGVTYKNAYVVKNQRSGRSKGFGFAEFENETDQQKALNAVNNKTVDERTLVVKVALTEAPQQAKKPEENKPASPAPAQKQ
jgi:RNA recognition motif-containing protein